MGVFDPGRSCLYMVLTALALAGCSQQADDGSLPAELATQEFVEVTMDWRQRRLQRLTEPYGWLSLSGLHRLAPGVNTVGAGQENDIVLARGPAQWGRVLVAEDLSSAWFEVSAEDQVLINGERRQRGELLIEDEDGPTRVEADGIRVHLVRSGEVPALRVRDPQAESRQSFVGLDYYEPDPAWRVGARFIKHAEGSTLRVANVMGQLIDEPNPGRAEFEVDGQTISLEAVLSDGRLFFIFADRTSGSETYGLGRFLYADLPERDELVLDFNQAYNPPCAFNAFTTCPLPPSSNRIPLVVRAGEKSYSGTPGLQEPAEEWRTAVPVPAHPHASKSNR